MLQLLTFSLLACSSVASSTAGTVPSTQGTDSGASSGSGLSEECPSPDTAGEGRIAEVCCDTSSSLQIFGGEGEPIDMEPGGDLPISYSPQYGWEFQLFPKVCGTRDVITLEVRLTDVETGALLQDTTEKIAVFPDTPDSCCQDGWVRYDRLDVRDLPDAENQSWAATLCGREVQVSLTGRDSDGREAAETLNLFFSADPEALGHACGE